MESLIYVYPTTLNEIKKQQEKKKQTEKITENNFWNKRKKQKNLIQFFSISFLYGSA